METEDRLIGANALMEHLDSCIATTKGLFKSVCVAIKCFVEQMPTVDAAEVVRCKDCNWCKKYHSNYMCQHPTEGMPGDVYADDFCSYGERKDND